MADLQVCLVAARIEVSLVFVQMSLSSTQMHMYVRAKWFSVWTDDSFGTETSTICNLELCAKSERFYTGPCGSARELVFFLEAWQLSGSDSDHLQPQTSVQRLGVSTHV